MIVNLSTVKLSTVSGLLGNVFPNLRAVCVDSRENLIYIGFYYDGELTNEEKECCESTLDQIFADCSYISEEKVPVNFETKILRLDYPKKMPLIGDWVYYRHEDSSRYID